MTLTEEEARKKWCHTDTFGKCQASECMAWRWDYTPRDAAADKHDAPSMTFEPTGHCGLAGKP